jgi:GNAT superfamily N-acetyltransferase
VAWAVARDLRVETVDGWPFLHLAAAPWRTAIVCAEPPTARWPGLLRRIVGDPGATLTVVTRRATAYVDELPVGVRVDRDDETLMWRPLAGTPDPARGADVSAYDVQHDVDGDRLTVRLVADERVVSEGTVAVVGHDAAYDRIETLAARRRRGLGGWVMAELDRWAVEQGARSGLLVATPDGAALYASRGWRVVAPVYSLVGSDSTSTNTSSALGSATM